ncbi:hypothetical protein LBMAG37_13040 [Anaerolineae bacterium]|nr:hypothetical protein LBMAG37_13040 [Anaerolineae bacterium]
MTEPVDAVVMLGALGASTAEQLLQRARWLATLHTLQQLAGCADVGRIVLAAPAELQTLWQADAPALGLLQRVTWDSDPAAAPFHFGERLAALVAQQQLTRVLYAGGGSMPLLGAPRLAELAAQLRSTRSQLALTNNLYSSDWLGLSDARALAGLSSRLPRDNMLGWVLQQEAGFDVRADAASAATRLDIDTPADLLALRWHTDTPAALRAYLAAALPPALAARWLEVQQVLARGASHIALIGRVSAAVWQLLESRTQVWARVFAEERGMTASGRAADGRVRSVIADHIERAGADGFFMQLGEWVNAVLFDNRVYLAHHKSWPPAADRFAADLGWVAAVQDVRLRELAAAAQACRAPVIMGGYGVVSGGLYAMLEGLPQSPALSTAQS